MDLDKVLAVMGSPGSGKSTTAVKLALSLAAHRKNVIIVFCDPFTPVIPGIVPAGVAHDRSLGSLLTAPALTQKDILDSCVPVRESRYISLLGYRAGESLMQYPQITRDQVTRLFVSLRYLADYVIIDCSSVFEADPASIIAIEVADVVLRLGTANLKGISYYQTHMPMLADSRFRKETHKIAIGNQKVGQDWEAVSSQYGAVSYVLPYLPELEWQDSELCLFQPLLEPDSVPYQTEIRHILSDLFSVQGSRLEQTDIRKKGKQPKVQEVTKKERRSAGIKMPFTRNRGEF